MGIADTTVRHYLDILTGNMWGDINYFENLGESWMENPEPFQGITGEQNTTPALADLDADGDVDLTLGQYSGIFDYYKNNALVAGIEKQPAMIGAIKLCAFPNPFSSELNLHFNLSETSDVSMFVADIFGQMVYSESHSNLSPGHQLLKWEAKDFQSGVYFIRIFTGKQQETIKVVLEN